MCTQLICFLICPGWLYRPEIQENSPPKRILPRDKSSLFSEYIYSQLLLWFVHPDFWPGGTGIEFLIISNIKWILWNKWKFLLEPKLDQPLGLAFLKEKREHNISSSCTQQSVWLWILLYLQYWTSHMDCLNHSLLIWKLVIILVLTIILLITPSVSEWSYEC